MIARLIKKYCSFLTYVFWGGVATLVNIGTFMVSIHLGIHYQMGNVIAWLLATLVTYLSNKFLVFHSGYHGVQQMLRELSSFLCARSLALLMDFVIIWTGISLLRYPALAVKIFDNVVVGILNYLVSKWVIFSEK
ncbi:cell wall teichoic acid glycosylation protein [Ligilactobacillus salitolerans]|uniref:Cell wall teichoic acid glycosylation protein n=1 Tax=Ligilactobacillus salitolerans TaxID=1808352 RepID=A0A401IW84_9LACO|nr:GtrA family protein [Ligilactobacillus salitolerans]GBG95765.1 cell wall teichoic acid glycosylation protein [Ligilactobacillus salitolerans]